MSEKVELNGYRVDLDNGGSVFAAQFENINNISGLFFLFKNTEGTETQICLSEEACGAVSYLIDKITKAEQESLRDKLVELFGAGYDRTKLNSYLRDY